MDRRPDDHVILCARAGARWFLQVPGGGRVVTLENPADYVSARRGELGIDPSAKVTFKMVEPLWAFR